jgi:hypothetical protein
MNAADQAIIAAAAERWHVDPECVRVLEVSPSLTFPDFYVRGTTTWVLLDVVGDVQSITLEELLGLETAYPVDRELSGISGDYSGFVWAQLNGPTSARRYAMRHSENNPDEDGTQAQRLSLFRQIRANSRRRLVAMAAAS